MSRTKPYSRTIPHPLFERLIVEDAMKEEKEPDKLDKDCYIDFLMFFCNTSPYMKYIVKNQN